MKARISRPSRSTMQSGRGATKAWILEYELETARIPNPLMGWTTGDTLNQVRVRFATREAAEAFAQKEGLEYVVLEIHERRTPPKNYADNFRNRERRES
ncbi:MAG: ETC complex I subunit [Pseudomonadota bacterium]|nr:ETC complex I subunit [Pseudomonadota bacterium]